MRTKTVLVDGLVLLKITKHCQDEIVQTGDVVNGVLLGLITDDTLEVTHCFPNLPITDDAENGTSTYDASIYPTKMIRQLREVNVDYLEIGFYQSSNSGDFINKISLENLNQYHNILDDSIMLIYDPTKAARGQISLKAFQLTNEMKEILSQINFDDITNPVEQQKLKNINCANMWIEVPVVIRNSHLVNCLVGTVNETNKTNIQSYKSLDSGSNLMDSIRTITENLDTLCQHVQSHLIYKKLMNRANSKPLPILPDKLDTTLLNAEITQSCQDQLEFCGEMFAKLKLIQGLHQDMKD